VCRHAVFKTHTKSPSRIESSLGSVSTKYLLHFCTGAVMGILPCFQLASRGFGYSSHNTVEFDRSTSNDVGLSYAYIFDLERSNSAVLCSKRYLGSKSRLIAVPDTER